MRFALSALLATVLTAASARADEPRELKPHVHGHGTLDIAIEESEVALVLEVPGMDILGFEHAAQGKDQNAAVERARKALAEPLTLFGIPPSAGCKVEDVKVALGPEHEHEGGGKGHDRAGEDNAAPANGDHEHHEEEGHSEVHATYALRCARPAEITSIGFEYFKSFPGAERLSVNVVTEKAQNSYEVSRDKPTLELGRTM